MISKQYDAVLLWLLRVGTVFMLAQAIFHASGLRLIGVEKFWPESAVLFARYFVMFWASASFMVAVVCYFAQKHLEQAKPLLVMLVFPALFHSLILLWFSFSPFTKIMPLPSLTAWLPFYEVWIRCEAISLLLYVGLVVYGKWKKFV